MNRCLICQKQIKDFSLNKFLNPNELICDNCYCQMNSIDKKFKINGIKAIALYKYNDFMKKVILQIKMHKDYELAQNILNNKINSLKRKFKNYYLVYVPSTKDSDQQRGFNHVETIFNGIGIKKDNIFFKKENYKQSNIKFKDRNKISKIIDLKKRPQINQKYLIVDDIITSQNSLKTCINLLKKNNVSKIKVLVLAYNCRNNKKFYSLKLLKRIIFKI
ncbi:MAG: phosphoribosyltransferase family protein [Bacilli bacterium]|nr:hypothetical protein [Bacilli bacterium]